MQRIADDVPDLEALDDNAIADHLYALILPCLKGDPQQQNAANTIVRRRAQEDGGRVAIEQTCKELHAILKQDQLHRVTMYTKVFEVILKFSKHQPRIMNSDSNSFPGKKPQ